MRIIHRFDFKGDDLVKGINFEGLRPLAKIENIIDAWGEDKLHEMHFQGATSSIHDKIFNTNIIEIVRKKISRPISVGGGIKNIQTAKKIISSGADRITVNTQLFKQKDFYSKLIKELGLSTVIVSVDVSKKNNEYYCFIDNGRECTKIRLTDHLNNITSINKGEILITNIDTDGTSNGIDKKLIDVVCNYSGPLILSGGFSRVDDVLYFKERIENPSSGVSIGKAFHNFIMKSKNFKNNKNFAFASNFDYSFNSNLDNAIDPETLFSL